MRELSTGSVELGGHTDSLIQVGLELKRNIFLMPYLINAASRIYMRCPITFFGNNYNFYKVISLISRSCTVNSDDHF